jgi:hypothetical protein
MLLKRTLISDEGVYCYVNGRALSQSAVHSDLFLPSRDANRESPCDLHTLSLSSDSQAYLADATLKRTL